MGFSKIIHSTLKSSMVKSDDFKAKLSRPHFLMSAENPLHPHKNELKMDHQQTLSHLRSKGFDAHEVHGHYGSPEKSIAIFNVKPEHVEHLHSVASKLGQDSSIYSDGKNHEMRFHHGENAGKKITGSGTVFHSDKPKDLYTTLPGNAGHFTHNFNFDKSEDSSSHVGLVHYSHMPDLKTVDPKFQGTGVDSHVKGRDTSHPHSFFYREGTQPEDIVHGKATHKYSAKIDTKSQPIYDIGKDPNGYVKKVKEENQGVFHMDGLHQKLKTDGFHGFHNSNHPSLKHVIVMYHPVSVSGSEKLNKTETLEKGAIKNIGLGIAAAGAIAAGTMSNKKPEAPKQSVQQEAPKQSVQQEAPAPKTEASNQEGYSTKKMMNTIAQVESSGGRNIAHKPVEGSMHQGEAAHGAYGLMPVTIRETIGAHKDLRDKHGKATKLSGQDLHNYMKQNPGLEHQIAERHVKRLEHHFGQDPAKIGHAWFQGITATHRAIKNKKDINGHWHVQKIMNAYGKEK